jgi:sigma-B regulation protein RsbU (phosphoserine phosphatase)
MDTSPPNHPLRNWRSSLIIAILYFLAAFLIAKMPLLYFGSPVWPSAGIALGGLLARGRSSWWGIAIGAALNSWFISKVNFLSGIIGGLIPAVGAWIAATLVMKLNRTGNFLTDVRHAFTFFVVNSCTGTLLQSVLGALNVMGAGFIKPENYVIEALNWWIGDTIGILVIAPMIVAWWGNDSSLYLSNLSKQRWWQLGAVISSLGMVSYFTFWQAQPVEYLLVPPLLWSAFRLGARITTLLVAITGMTAAIATLYGQGIFYRVAQQFNSVIFLQLFMGVISLTTVIILALVAENDQALAKQRQALAQLDQINHNLEAMIDERTEDLRLANREIQILNQKLTAENLRMSSELEVTRRLQEMILPKAKELQNIPDLDIAGFMQPADEVGGDYYDVLQRNHDSNNIKIGIGDVTGHGLESGVVMIMVQTAIRTLIAHGETDPAKFLGTVNQAIYHNLQRMNCDKSLTLMLMDYHDRQLHITGQHESVIIIRKDGAVEVIDTVDLGFPIGLTDAIEDLIFDLKIQLQQGDVVALYTDGITEAENPQRELYGLDRFIGVLKQYRHESVEVIRQSVIEDVMRFVNGTKVYDDITLVILKPKPEM